ncbi:hypothetical protein A2U01_0072493, partial [Trifolium medium]|nr:hypothetical protein [Trifolium medium]
GWNVVHNPDTQTPNHVSCDLHCAAIVPEKHEQNARHIPDKMRPIAIDVVVPWSDETHDRALCCSVNLSSPIEKNDALGYGPMVIAHLKPCTWNW